MECKARMRVARFENRMPLLVATLVAAGLAANADADTYPSKPIRLIALSSPGSGPDIVGRLVGARLTKSWGQQVVVDTRPGATGIIGAEIASKSAPDGYTLVILTSQQAIVSGMYSKLPYDLARDFAPITLMATTPFILAVNPSVPAHSVSELIEYAKAHPGQLRYGSGGSGSPPHLCAEIFKHMTGIDMLHVPYKGITPAMLDAVGGQVQLVFSVIPAVLATVKAGKLRPLGVTSMKRTPLVPDVPPIADTVPGYSFFGWYALAAPRGTPKPILDRLNAEIVDALKTPEFHDRFSAFGAEPVGTSAAEAHEFMLEQMAKMREAVKTSGAKVD
jgi:tripartite-type tricarboxylate transporter receptor subunit TctC